MYLVLSIQPDISCHFGIHRPNLYLILSVKIQLEITAYCHLLLHVFWVGSCFQEPRLPLAPPTDDYQRLQSSVVLVSIRQILLVIVLFLERILESSLVLVLGGSNTCK